MIVLDAPVAAARPAPVHASDADLIGASLTDPSAFGFVFERHTTTIHRYLVRRVGPSHADTLSNDVFEIAFRRRADFDLSNPSARPWLYGIATNLVARLHRSEARRLRATARLAARPTNTSDPADTVADAGDTRDRLTAAAAALAALPAAERDTLLLFAWEELSYDEIAVTLGIPVGTVRSRLDRARSRVRAGVEAAAADHRSGGGSRP